MIDIVVTRERSFEIVETPDNQTTIDLSGTRGPAGPTGPPGASVSSYTHTQGAPSAVWTIEHNLGMQPAGLQIWDSEGNQWHGRIQHINENTLSVTFYAYGMPTPIAGVAHIS